MTIVDGYELIEGDGVCFAWVTALPVQITEHTAVITSKRGKAVVTFADDCTVGLEILTFFDGGHINKITAVKNDRLGKITVDVKLYGGENA